MVELLNRKALAKVSPNSEVPVLESQEEGDTMDGVPLMDPQNQWAGQLSQKAIATGLNNYRQQWIRRTFRLMCLSTWLFIIGLAFYLYVYLTYLNKTVLLSGDSLTVYVRDCKVTIEYSSGFADNTIQAHIKAYNSNDTVTHTHDTIQVLNPFTDVEACQVHVKGNMASSAMLFVCQHNCWIEQKGDNLAMQSLQVASIADDSGFIEQGRLKLKSISADKILVEFVGTVTIRELETTEGGAFNVTYGDLWVQTKNDASVAFATYESGAYCFASTAVGTSVAAVCDWSTLYVTNTTSFSVENCVGKYNLCKNSGCYPSIEYSAIVTDGGVYFNLVGEDGYLIDTPQSVNGGQTLQVNIRSQITIDEIVNSTFGLDVNKDKIIIMDQPGIFEDHGRWMFTTNIAYAQLTAWWLSLISFNLLVPETKNFNIRIVPNICPMQDKTWHDTQVGLTWDAINTQYGNQENAETIWMEKSDSKDTWYKYKKGTDLQYKKSTIKILDNPFLFSALMISLFLGFSAGLAAMVGIYFCLRSFSVKFWKKLEHQRRYNRCKKTVEEMKNENMTVMEENDNENDDENDENDDNEEEQEEGEEESDEPTPGEGLLPPPYAVPDLVIAQSRNSSLNSLESFLKNAVDMVLPNAEVPMQVIRLTEIKEKYEAFCFLNGYQEMSIKEHKSLFLSKDMEFLTINDTTTEVFRKIRFKNKKEIVDQGRVTQMPDENSLAFFVRCRTVVTPFNKDMIYMKDFQLEYEKFCRAEKVAAPVPITKRGMESMGSIFERLQITALKLNGRFRINWAKIDDLLENPMDVPLTPGWCCSDFCSVTLHVFFAAWIILPLALPPLLITAKHAMFSARDIDYILTYTDLNYAWWEIIHKLRYMPAYFAVLLILACLLEFLALFELVTYYLYQIFPFKSENVLRNMHGVRWISQTLYYVVFLFLIGWICFLFIVAICWFILGAVLNPDLYLSYCSGAATLVSFCMGQLASLNFLRTEIFKRVKEGVWDRLRGMLMLTLGAVTVGLAASSASSRVISRENKTLQVFAKTSLGDVAENLEIDHKLAAALAHGDDEAIPILAQKFGANPLIIAAILAVVFKDNEKLMRVVEDLAQVPAINIPPDLAKMIVNISLKQKDANIRSTVKMATIQFVKMKKEMGADPTMYSIDPRAIEALVAMSRGFVDRFITTISNSDTHISIIKILFLIKGLIEQKMFEATDNLTNLLIEYCDVPEDVAKSVASLCDETYSAKFQNDFSGWNSMIDTLCDKLGIQDGLLMQLIVHITRNNMGAMLRIMNNLTEVLNGKHKWNLDSGIISSLLLLVNGSLMDLDKFAAKYELSNDLVNSLSPLFSEKRFTEIQTIIPEEMLPERRASVGEEEIIARQSESNRPIPENIPPFIKALAENLQPTGESMEWMAKFFKLTGDQLLGLYSILRGANKSQKSALKAITQEVLRRMRVDEEFTNYMTAATIWATSYDADSIREAQATLKMGFRDLTYVAKRMLDPKELPIGIFTKIGIRRDDPVVKRRRALSWKSDPDLCKDWCRATAMKIAEAKGIKRKRKNSTRSQLMLAFQYPQVYMKQIFEKKIQCDDESQRKYKTLITTSFLKQMQGNRRKDQIINLARLFEMDSETMEIWVEMVLEDNLEIKIDYMKKWIQKIGLDCADNAEKFLLDYANQNQLYFESTLGFGKLAKELGFPFNFTCSLSNGIIDTLESYPEYFNQFIKDFCGEMGIENKNIQDSIVCYVNQESSGLEPFGKALGFKPNSISMLVSLFGSMQNGLLTPIMIVEKFGELLESIGVNDTIYNGGKAVLAICLKLRQQFKIRNFKGLSNKASASEIIEELAGIPKVILDGMMSAADTSDRLQADSLIEMSRSHVPGFRLEESHCRGIISMAYGQVANVEDICQAINFDADIAEVLVTISENNDLSHTLLKASSHFQKFMLKLGLDHEKMAALIALTCEDLEHCDEIAEDLDEGRSIKSEFLRCLIAIYMFFDLENEWDEDYKPMSKIKKLKKFLPWLCKAIGVANSQGALLMLRLAQGDASAIVGIQSKMGWNGTDLSYYASLACLVSPLPFKSEYNSKGKYDWMSFKHLETITGNLSDLLKLNEKMLTILIQAARSESSALNWIRKKLNFPTIRDVQRFISSLIYSEEPSDSDEYSSDEENTSMADSSSQGSSSNYSSNASNLPDDASVDSLKGNLVERVDPQVRILQLSQLVTALNSRQNPKEKSFTQETVKLLLSLSSGSLENIHLLEEILNSVYENEPPISFVSAREIMAVSTGNITEIAGLTSRYEDLYMPSKDAEEEDKKGSADSMMNMFNLLPSSVELQFLVRLARGDHNCWEMKTDTDAYIGQRVHNDPRLLQAFTALISENHYGVIETIDTLAEFTELDRDMLLSLVLISENAIELLPAGITPLTQRLEVDSLVAGAFIPSCYKTTEMLEQAFQSCCEKMSTPPVNAALVAAVYKGAKGDIGAWVQLGMFYMNLYKNTDRENLDQVLILRAFESILTDKYQTEIKDSMFVSNIIEEPEILLSPGKFGPPILEDEDGIELVPLASPTPESINRSKDALVRCIGFHRFRRSSIVKRMLENEFRSSSGQIMVDLIVGIADNDLEMAPIVMRMLHEDPSRHELVKAFLSLYNDSTEVLNATELIEDYISKNPTQLPPGSIQTIIGARKGFSAVAGKGIEKAAKNPVLLWNENYTTGISKVIVSTVQAKLNDNWDRYADIITEFAKKITGIDDITHENKTFQMIIQMLMGKIKAFIKLGAQEFDLKNKDLKELFILCVPKNPWSQAGFPCTTTNLKKLIPKMPEEVIECWLKLIGREVEDLDYGRKGMGEVLYPFIKFILESLPKEARFKKKKGASDEQLPEIKIFDAFFLACTDPYKYTKPIADAMPDLGRALMNEIKDDIITLLTGLVSLFQSDRNQVIRHRAITDLSNAFMIDYNIVKGFVSLAKSDWEGLSDMAGRFCEFDPHKVAQLVMLVKRLKLIGDEEYNEKDQNEYARLKEKLDEGGDIDNIFHMLDKDGSGELDFQEFTQVMKFFDLEMTNQRLLQIFSKFDADGSGNMSLQEFEAAFDYLKSEVSRGAMEGLGLAKKKLALIFLGSLMILLLVFAFLFLGIIGFITVSRFGSAVNSMLPMSSGVVISKLRGSGGNLQTKIDEIGGKITNSLNIMTVEENNG
ncbi:unnamed protein product [Blepharisma stoltei]|uniref:EF-hand domain-containing protein n=1 Tax=Blepharisma stoltei TaxID=1481888 RepID=A0AAU9IIE2_9CILI|nr:unnamed protein product [Blepharisma stoltei]